MDKTLSMKFGGTSVATAERRQMVVEHVRREVQAGYRVALVISAMGRRGDPYATDTLLDLLRNQGGVVDPRNYSFLFVTGEMISVGVMTHTLQLAGLEAVGLTGGMAGVCTEDFHMSARVVKLDNRAICEYLASGKIPVVCGGQGMTQTRGDFSILGRGGSDTSGVLVGIMAGAERADIYTDVEYMLAIDPRIVADAPRREVMSFEAAYEMARFGAKVIHPGSVRLGMQNHLPIRVRSTFSQNPGTLIDSHTDAMPLVGMPVVASAQVAVLPPEKISPDQIDTLEQHLGLLTLVEATSGNLVLCAPSGDTASQVDQELALLGMGELQWQPGYSLVSLVGRPELQPEMDRKAAEKLAGCGIPYPYHELHVRRSTFVMKEQYWKTALEALYHALSGYLFPENPPDRIGGTETYGRRKEGENKPAGIQGNRS